MQGSRSNSFSTVGKPTKGSGYLFRGVFDLVCWPRPNPSHHPLALGGDGFRVINLGGARAVARHLEGDFTAFGVRLL